MRTSSSSISSSDARAARSFLALVLLFAAAGGALAWALLLIGDPFDTGRSTPFAWPGVAQTGPRLANASRTRDQRFNAAVIGNSTLQLLSPQRLKGATGLDFVQLTTPGTGPMEQAALAEHLFRLRGGGVEAVVLGLDRSWCDPLLETTTMHPFPFWLYADSDAAYAASLFRMQSVEFLFRRIALLLDRKRAARPDGFWDYEAAGAFRHVGGRPIAPEPIAPRSPDGRRAADGALRRILEAAPRGTRLLLLHPPVFAPASAGEGAERREIDACKAALAATAARRDATFVLDFWIDDEAARTRELFYDAVHFDAAMAQRLERAIADRLAAPP